VHRLIGVLHDFGDLEKLEGQLAIPEGLRFLPWSKVMPQLYDTIQGDRRGNWVFYGILVLVVALGVANTMTMAVMERTREFGVMMALGTSPYRLVAMVVCEAAWISALGAAAGLLVGGAANLVTARWGIPVGSEPISYGGLEISVMHAKNTFLAAVLSPALVLFSGIAASLLPAIRVARMKPVQAIREG
jgi:ABC-type antimicrobial peptide transport system permease subunit